MSENPEAKPPSGPLQKELTGRIGKYDIVKPLGKGAMGMVYLAHDTMLERDVALKVMVAAIADDPELKKRFEREAKAVAKMTHPNVVMVFDLGYHTDGSPFLAMELLKGDDLQKAMRQPPPMALDRKVTIILQTLAGLSHAHQAGIVHRDIKPANIFINQDGSVKIMDFGVARLTTASMTGTGNIVGTADYMSPEQVKGAKVDGRSDVFSVGCMLYELLTGRRPFHSDNLMAIFYKITHEEPSFDQVPSGPEYDALMPILKKALSKNLEDRYQSAYEFAVDLRDFLKSQAGSASAEHALEDLVDLEAPPTGAPLMGTLEGGGETEISAATMDLKPATGGRTAAPTVRGGVAPTVLQGGMAPTVATTPTAQPTAPAYPPRMGPRPIPQPAGGSPVLYVVLGGMGVALLALGGYVWYQRQQPPTPPVTQVAATPLPTPPPATAPPATLAPTPPPPTPAPPPTFKPAQGKGAAAMTAAQSAFSKGDYDTAIRQAQAALKADPGSSEAKRVLDNALEGQRAETRFAAARSALAANDYSKALSEAEAGRGLAPWDSRGTDLISTIQRAQQRARQEQEQNKQQAALAQVNTLLGQADNAFQSQKYDAAITLYAEVLKLDPQNARAGIGKANALGAKAMAAATAQAPAASGKSFVAAQTEASSTQTRSSGNLPPGFEETPGVVVQKGTQATQLPGKIQFDVDPESPKSGDKYTVKISFANEGAAPIEIASMLVTTTINGKKRSGPVPPLVKDVAPRQTAQLLVLPDYWKDDISSWTMEVTVQTSRGETYKNTVNWR